MTIAAKLNQSHGPVVLLWPKKGLSTLDREGKPYWDPDADKALLETLKKNLDVGIRVLESDAYINDPGFAKAVFTEFEKMTGTKVLSGKRKQATL